MSDKPATPPPVRLLDQVRHAIRVRHYSLRTENTYVDWIKRFILFHDKRHPGASPRRNRGLPDPAGRGQDWAAVVDLLVRFGAIGTVVGPTGWRAGTKPGAA